MSAEKKNSKPTLEEILDYPGAKSAFQKLIDDKVESRAIEYWLGTIGTSPDERPKASRDRRKTARLIRQATSLAQAIDRAEQSPPTLFLATGPEIQKTLGLSKALRTYAGIWKRALTFRPSQGPSPTPLMEAIGCLLEIVKSAAHNYHYREVATLLEATFAAYGRDEFELHWDEGNLSQLTFRRNRRMARFLSDIKPNVDVHKGSGGPVD